MKKSEVKGVQGQVLGVYTVRDSKACACLPPFTMRSDGEAIRAFGDSVNKGGTTLSDHPEDFVLMRVGSFDLVSGVMAAELPVSLAVGSDFKRD